MKIIEKILTAAVIATVAAFVIGFVIWVALELFGNPLDRKNVKNIAEQYVAENYSEMNPTIVDIDYFDTPVEGPYHVAVYLEKTGRTFTLHYSKSGDLEWDSYDYSIYEEKYGEEYFEEGLYSIRDNIGIPKNEKQKAVIAVINFDFEIQNGGLAQYLINEDDEYIEKIVDYLRMVGAEDQATLLETFMAENDIEFKSVETSSIEESIEFEQSKPFDKFNDAYMEIYIPEGEHEPYLSFCIIDYIQENIEDF